LPYFRTSTASQRKRLFEVWEETGKVSHACRKAKLSRTAFYRWCPRFKKEGYSGLKKPLKHTPHNPNKTSESIASQIESLKREHPEWGNNGLLTN
jgi:transposase